MKCKSYGSTDPAPLGTDSRKVEVKIEVKIRVERLKKLQEKVLFKLTFYNWLKLSEHHTGDCRRVDVCITNSTHFLQNEALSSFMKFYVIKCKTPQF
jgi:hypothetical protein